MATKDHRINEHGVNIFDLKAGQWITVRWDDVGDVRCLLLEIEPRQATYKGDRGINVFEFNEHTASWQVQKRADHSQVIAIHGVLSTIASVLS